MIVHYHRLAYARLASIGHPIIVVHCGMSGWISRERRQRAGREAARGSMTDWAASVWAMYRHLPVLGYLSISQHERDVNCLLCLVELQKEGR
jgi:hypothetical protein